MTKTTFRLSIYFILLGCALLFASRFLQSSSLILLARDLRFGQPLSTGLYREIYTRITFFKDAMWFCGFGIIISGLASLFAPERLRRLIEETAAKPGRSLLFFFLFIQIILAGIFLITEQRLWWGKMYGLSAPGGSEQRWMMCGRGYRYSCVIGKDFNPDDRLLLAGKNSPFFFLNYYMYPLRLYLYDERVLAPYEVARPYVKRWMRKKQVRYILIYTPYTPTRWCVLTLKRK